MLSIHQELWLLIPLGMMLETTGTLTLDMGH